MLCVYSDTEKLWNEYPITFVNIMNAHLMGRLVMVTDRCKDGYRQGKITGVRLESGSRMGTTPKHLLVELNGLVEMYVLCTE